MARDSRYRDHGAWEKSASELRRSAVHSLAIEVSPPAFSVISLFQHFSKCPLIESRTKDRIVTRQMAPKAHTFWGDHLSGGFA